MFDVSDAFKNAVRNGQHDAWIVRADLSKFGEIQSADIPIVGGEISVDRTAAIRRRATLDIMPELEFIPASSADALFPVGVEMTVRAGFRLMDGTEELVPQGVFRITKPHMTDNGDTIALQIDGYDRSRAVSRARFTGPYQIAQGTLYSDAIKAIILRAIPWLPATSFRFMPTTLQTPPLLFDTSDDPWQVCMDMARSLGAEVFFDQIGQPTLLPEPDPATSNLDWEYVEGEDANILEVLKDLDDEQAYNGVIVTGTSVSEGVPEIHAEAWDTDPHSPTYYNPADPVHSLYGPVPYFMDSQYITSQTQAIDAAQGNLRRVVGVLEQVDFSATPNPAHDGGDIVKIVRERMKVDSLAVVDGLRIPLTFGQAMQGNTRKRRILE